MKDERRLTPVQRLRQAEPSWLRSGQTTALFSSDTEKDPVSEALGGIPTAACTLAGRARWEEGCDAGRGALMRVGSSTGSLRSLGSSESLTASVRGEERTQSKLCWGAGAGAGLRCLRIIMGERGTKWGRA